jgi:membrane protease YdiL (CAAX protease family)
MFMPFVGLGLWEQVELSAWLEIAYHVINAIILLFLIGRYLAEEWFMASTDFRYYLKHIALTVGLMVGIEFLLLRTLRRFGVDIVFVLEGLPVVELSVSHTPSLLVSLEPIFGTIAFMVFTPITVCSLFYCLGFAPVCYKKPWLAYLCIGVITFFPVIVNILWRDENYFSVAGYIAYLPIHLLACWSYQKTDTIWAPIATHSVINLISSLLICYGRYTGNLFLSF